ncbi:MAG: F0F1 ATP synthase subunit B [Halothermotrichaceae bacterium]
MININWTIFWETVNFFVLMFILIKYIYKPVTKMLDKRSQKIKDDLDTAAQRKDDAEELKKKYEARLQEAHSDAQQIIEDAEKRSKERAEEIVNEARAEAVRLKERAQKEIERAKEEAVNELREEVTSISLQVAGKFMQEKLKKQQHENLIKQYIEDLDQNRLGEVQ